MSLSATTGALRLWGQAQPHAGRTEGWALARGSGQGAAITGWQLWESRDEPHGLSQTHGKTESTWQLAHHPSPLILPP